MADTNARELYLRPVTPQQLLARLPADQLAVKVSKQDLEVSLGSAAGVKSTLYTLPQQDTVNWGFNLFLKVNRVPRMILCCVFCAIFV